jgi:SAM-dependent methyltransferase
MREAAIRAAKALLGSPIVPGPVRAVIRSRRAIAAVVRRELAKGAGRDADTPRQPTPAPAPPPAKTLEDEIRRVCFIEGRYPDGWPKHDRCPCCTHGETAYIFSKHELRHSMCKRCSFVFLDPYPSDALLERIYNADYYPAVRRFVELPKARVGKISALFSFPEAVLERTIAQAAPSKEGSWLEVGGGIGHFAQLIRQRRPSWRVVLNEMNASSVSLAREVYGLETLAQGADAMLAAGLRFEVISMIAVLEHVPRPFEMLSQYARLLAPGGRLVIGVPRFSPLNRSVSKDSSASVTPPYHVSHFDEINLGVLLDRIGSLDREHRVVWQDGPNAFKLIDLVKSWPHYLVEVPDHEIDAPRCVESVPFQANMLRWLNALAAADEQTRDLIADIDGGLYLTTIAVRGPNP